MLRITVMCGNRLNCWNTMPSSVRLWRRYASEAGTSSPFLRSCHSGSPSTVMTPPLIVSSVIRMRSTVDLPEPDGPMIDTFSPGATVKSSSSSTT